MKLFADNKSFDLSSLPTVKGKSGDDLLSFKTPQIRFYSNADNVKNIPSNFTNPKFFTAIYLINKDNDNGELIAIDTYLNIAFCGLNGLWNYGSGVWKTVDLKVIGG